MLRLQVIGQTILVSSSLVIAGPVAAQDLQASKPIRFIVGLSAGGGTDVTARLIAQNLAINLNIPTLVENKAGGNFIPAGKEVMGAAPTATRSPSSRRALFITQALFPDYPFDITKFAAVTEVATGPLILVVRNDLGVKTVGELIGLTKKEPGKIRFGMGGGVGSSLGVATASY